nr:MULTISPECIES: PipA/GogA/GtgA family type III secretion system effector [unclassified Pseudomonas]
MIAYAHKELLFTLSHSWNSTKHPVHANMFSPSQLLTKPVVATALLSPIEISATEDQGRAAQHADMAAQLKNPSLLRHEHDLKAIDTSHRLEPARLREYLLTPEALKIEGKTQAYQRHLSTLLETMVKAYQQSPTFRRLCNYAVATGRLDNQGQFSLTLEAKPNPPHALTPTLRSAHNLDYQPYRSAEHFQSATGQEKPSRQRLAMDQMLAAITGLPRTEGNHPRGPINEYANIVLKDISPRTEHAYISPSHASQPPTSRGQIGPRTHLNQVLIDNPQDRSQATHARAIKRQVAEKLQSKVAERLDLIAARPSNTNPLLMQRSKIDQRNAQALVPVLSRLLIGINGTESPLEMLEAIAHQNARQQLFSYRSDKHRDPFEMVAQRDGDCTSFVDVFKLLGNALGIEHLSSHHLQGPMRFTLSTTPEIVNGEAGQDVEFARHTILVLTDPHSGESLYFDPVFGRRVAPEHYGHDFERYLIKS